MKTTHTATARARHAPSRDRQVTYDWLDAAACREEDPELFFPIGNNGVALMQVNEAKSICGRCPVTEACLQWALTSGQEAGVWGGTTETQRKAMQRRATGNRARNKDTNPA